jgi:protease I
MGDKGLSGFKVAVLAGDGVEDVPLEEPIRALEEAGAKVTMIAPQKGGARPIELHDRTNGIRENVELSEADPAEFDALLLSDSETRDASGIDEQTRNFVRNINRQDKPIAMVRGQPKDLFAFSQDMIGIFVDEKQRKKRAA